MRKMAPIERLLLDLINDKEDKRTLRNNCAEKPLPQESEHAILNLLDEYLDEEEKSAVYRHYNISPREGWDSFNNVIEGVDEDLEAYNIAMLKLHTPPLSELWWHFAYHTLEGILREIKSLEKDLYKYEESAKCYRRDLANSVYFAKILFGSYIDLYSNRYLNGK